MEVHQGRRALFLCSAAATACLALGMFAYLLLGGGACNLGTSLDQGRLLCCNCNPDTWQQVLSSFLSNTSYAVGAHESASAAQQAAQHTTPMATPLDRQNMFHTPSQQSGQTEHGGKLPSTLTPSPSVSVTSATSAGRILCKAYLAIGAYWGLNNQFGSVLRGMATVRVLGNGTCLVMPQWSVDYDDPSLVWNLHPFDFFFDWEATATAAAAKGIRMVRELPSHLMPHCMSQLQNDRVSHDKITLELLKTWQNKYGVACLSAYNTNVGLSKVTGDHVSLPLISCLKPSKRFTQLVDLGLKTISDRYQTDSFVGVQGRVEGDWAHACQHGFRVEKEIFKKQCFVSDEVMNHFFVVERQLQPGSIMYIASGAPVTAFAVMCSTFKCITKAQLFNQTTIHENHDIFGHTTSAAFVDMLICARSSMFYGNIFSSFARTLSQVRVGMGLPETQYYNPLLDRAP